RLAQRDERAAASLDEERRLAAEQHDLSARDARGPRTRALRPRQHRAVRLRRIGCRQHERLRLVTVLRAELAQPLDRTAERELRAAETLDEVAAPARPERLERPQLRTHRAVAAGDPLAAHAVARDDALSLEQELGERTPVRPPREEARRQRPASLRRSHLRYARPREAAHAAVRAGCLVPALRAQRLPLVVRRLTGPDEIPERRQRDRVLEARRGEQVVPEERTRRERIANCSMRVLVRRGCAGR